MSLRNETEKRREINCSNIQSRNIFKKDLLHTRSAECNVHINNRMCVNIDTLIAVALILLTWRNCSSHCIIDLMLQEFNVYTKVQTFALMTSLHSKVRVFDFLHSRLRIKLERSKFSIVCLFHHLRYRLHFQRVDCKSVLLSIAMISISNISHRFAFDIKYKYFYSYRKSDRSESLFWSEISSIDQFSRLDQFVSRFSSFKYFQMIYHIIYSQISWFMFHNQTSNRNSRSFFHVFLCICIIY